MANENNDNFNDIEKRRALRQREKDLESFKILFEVDLKGNVEPEAWELYYKCLNLEISMEEFCERFSELTIKQAKTSGNKDSHYLDEVEMNLSLDQAKELFRKNGSDTKNISPGQAFFEKMCNPQILRENLKKAIEKSWAAGVPIIRQDKKGIYELYPDGTKKYVKIIDNEKG